MKRIIAGILLIVLSIGGSFWEYFNVQNRADNLISIMEYDRKITVSENKSERKRAEKIKAEWESNDKLLSAFLPHSEIDTVEIGVKNLINYNEQNLTDEYLEELNNCIATLYHIKESENPSLENIF